MDCKFKQLNLTHTNSSDSIGNHKKSHQIIQSDRTAKNTIKSLLDNVAKHIYNEKALEKSKSLTNNNFLNFQINSISQIEPNKSFKQALFIEEKKPQRQIIQPMRPLSARIYRTVAKTSKIQFIANSHKSISSHKSGWGTSKSSDKYLKKINEQNQQKKYKRKNLTAAADRFIPLNLQKFDPELNSSVIQTLRAQKNQQQVKRRKKEEFLQSIKVQAINFSHTQAKFAQSMSNKKFIYGQNFQIVLLDQKMESNHLKKITAISKNRIIAERNNLETKTTEQEGKENIYVKFSGKQTLKASNRRNHNNLGQWTQRKLMTDMIDQLGENKSNKTIKLNLTKKNLNTTKNKAQPTQKASYNLTKITQNPLFYYENGNGVYRMMAQRKSTEQLQKKI